MDCIKNILYQTLTILDSITPAHTKCCHNVKHWTQLLIHTPLPHKLEALFGLLRPTDSMVVFVKLAMIQSCAKLCETWNLRFFEWPAPRIIAFRTSDLGVC
jgi:hypothetical protein